MLENLASYEALGSQPDVTASRRRFLHEVSGMFGLLLELRCRQPLSHAPSSFFASQFAKCLTYNLSTVLLVWPLLLQGIYRRAPNRPYYANLTSVTRPPKLKAKCTREELMVCPSKASLVGKVLNY